MGKLQQKISLVPPCDTLPGELTICKRGERDYEKNGHFRGGGEQTLKSIEASAEGSTLRIPGDSVIELAESITGSLLVVPPADTDAESITFMTTPASQYFAAKSSLAATRGWVLDYVEENESILWRVRRASCGFTIIVR